MKGVHHYSALREITAAVNSGLGLKEVLALIVRSTARALKTFACSLILLDASGKKLIHGASFGLSQQYLHKGVLDADRSLAEVREGKAVAILEADKDPRVQYPELAAKAGISSILGVPLRIRGDLAGTIRVYSRRRRQFSEKEVELLSIIADLSTLALEKAAPSRALVGGDREKELIEGKSLVSRVGRPVAFAHPSEEEFAKFLDFYQIEWVYEPRSFPLEWKGERVTEAFTPDFYLPGLDLYVELTTMKQSLVTDKNRKLRHLKELYPGVKIRLLYKRDYDRLLAKYGYGPLAQAKIQGAGRVLFGTSRIQRRVRELARQISRDYAGRRPLMVGILKGVFCFMADLIRNIELPLDVDFMAISYYGGGSEAVRISKDLDTSIAGRDVIMVEDIVDTGMTLRYVLSYLEARGPASLAVCTLLDKRVRRLVEVPLTYVGFEVPDEFAVGYGLDYREEYRNLPFIAVLKTEGERKDKPSTAASPQK